MTEKRTRSNSLNSRLADENTSKGRKFSDLSPDLIIKQSKRTKSKAKDMDEILSSINKKLELLPVLEQKIDAISADFHELKQEVNAMKQRITAIEEIQRKNCEKIDKHRIEMNITKQLSLENQLMVTDIPKSITKEKFIADVDIWTKGLLSELGYKKLILSQNAKSAIAFIHLWSIKDKHRFMDFVRTREKSKDGRYTAITNSMVFQLNEDDTSNPKIVNFRTPMTEQNREIFNQARKMKKQNENIERCWMSNGSILIKMKGQVKHTKLDDIQQLEDIKNSLHMELP